MGAELNPDRPSSAAKLDDKLKPGGGDLWPTFGIRCSFFVETHDMAEATAARDALWESGLSDVIDDFVERGGATEVGSPADVTTEPASELDRLRAENERLREALAELYAAGFALTPLMPPMKAKAVVRWDDAMGVAADLSGANDERRNDGA